MLFNDTDRCIESLYQQSVTIYMYIYKHMYIYIYIYIQGIASMDEFKIKEIKNVNIRQYFL